MSAEQRNVDRARDTLQDIAEALSPGGLPPELQDPAETFDWTTGTPRARTPEDRIREVMQEAGWGDNAPLPAQLRDPPSGPRPPLHRAHATQPTETPGSKQTDGDVRGRPRHRRRWIAAAVLLLATVAAAYYYTGGRLGFLRPRSAALRAEMQPPDLDAAGIPGAASLSEPSFFLDGRTLCSLYSVHTPGAAPNLAAFDNTGAPLWTAARDLKGWAELVDPRVRITTLSGVVVDDDGKEKIFVLLVRDSQQAMALIDPARHVIDGSTVITGRVLTHRVIDGRVPTRRPPHFPEVVPLGDGTRGILVGGSLGIDEKARAAVFLLDDRGRLLQALQLPLLGVRGAEETGVDAVRVDWGVEPAHVMLRSHAEFMFFETRIENRSLSLRNMRLAFGDDMRRKFETRNPPGSWDALVARYGSVKKLRDHLAASVRPADQGWIHDAWNR